MFTFLHTVWFYCADLLNCQIASATAIATVRSSPRWREAHLLFGVFRLRSTQVSGIAAPPLMTDDC
ncbi:hypothetical protein [Nostoc sp. NZL]|uniref:hypothetical protein n=1 Tax=Nostoc sp. NZL TaxID=2650612 RepID=UPI0018C708C9|nr:hypothetical protein [Nostoc sp. NZL]